MPPYSRSLRARAIFGDLPLDVLPTILAHLADRRDWHACALVSKWFCRVATPFLYHTLDSRIISKTLIHHPSATLLHRPELAKYVRHVTETGSIHRGLFVHHPNITSDTLAALALCTNLHSMTWADDTSRPGKILIRFLDVLKTLPLRELNIRTHSDLGEEVWSQLISLTGLRKVSVWCMEGPPRVLQGWSGPLGSTLTHLELGVSAFQYPCSQLLSQLPLLKDLRLKGAPASSIPTILTYLPNLRSLDTEFLGSYRPMVKRGSGGTTGASTLNTPAFPTLQHLTVRSHSMDTTSSSSTFSSTTSSSSLWDWILQLVPNPGLETFRLHAYTYNLTRTQINRMFLLEMAKVHGKSLRRFMVGDAQMMLGDLECLCNKFGGLEVISGNVVSPDVASISSAIYEARNLHTLKLTVVWIPKNAGRKFTLEEATDMMLRYEDSRLRVISIEKTGYFGKWILVPEEEPASTEATASVTVVEDNGSITATTTDATAPSPSPSSPTTTVSKLVTATTTSSSRPRQRLKFVVLPDTVDGKTGGQREFRSGLLDAW